MAAKKRGLGRGLDALLGQSNATEGNGYSQDQQLKELPVDLIQRGKYQPRRDMDPQALEELAESIRAQGVMQPIVVRSIGGERYEIIAGERRWRATQLAGLDTIPTVIRDVPDEAAIAMALIENIQREDLNPIEEAIALQRLQQDLAGRQRVVALHVVQPVRQCLRDEVVERDLAAVWADAAQHEQLHERRLVQPGPV